MASDRAPRRPWATAPEDQLLVLFDRLGELDERVEAAAPGPGEPADEQLRRGGQIAGLEDRSKLFFQQPGPVERPVGGLDGGQGAALVRGQRVGVFQQYPAGVLDAGGLLAAPRATQPGGQTAADLTRGPWWPTRRRGRGPGTARRSGPAPRPRCGSTLPRRRRRGSAPPPARRKVVEERRRLAFRKRPFVRHPLLILPGPVRGVAQLVSENNVAQVTPGHVCATLRV